MFPQMTLEMEKPFEEARGDDFGANLAETEEVICSVGESASFHYPTVSQINSSGLTRRTWAMGAASALPSTRVAGWCQRVHKYQHKFSVKAKGRGVKQRTVV